MGNCTAWVDETEIEIPELYKMHLPLIKSMEPLGFKIDNDKIRVDGHCRLLESHK